ncbi:MAG: Coenzyme F420 hydrogenase/dehydrogenase, beta subunit C-terminal domain [Dehalococcoidia bacterium]|nr:MAG: Coenzyme F420 hydrogenase/dehydrogenase, beta subunit C-terminal domain [Dehalococcoidia bacterium]
MGEGKGSLDLEKDVLNEGLCTSCGACVNICPYIKVVTDRVAVIEPCGIAEGKCYDFCPRTPTDISALNRTVCGGEPSETSLGSYISIEMAQARDSEIRRRAQYGGVVSAIMTYAINSGEIGSAVLTRPFDRGLMPTSALAEQGTQVLESAGSNYIASATLAELNNATKQPREAIGVVGIPCQILALRKMQTSQHETGAKTVKLAVGLFCTWALSYKGFREFLSGRLGTTAITRLDIPPPPANVLVVHTNNGVVEFPLDEIRGYIKPTCSVCFDMTSELADISVGMVEGLEDWNTLIVRTPLGEQLVARAKAEGVIETQSLDEARLAHLREASLNKKRRAIEEIVRRTGDESDLLYMRLSETDRRNLF